MIDKVNKAEFSHKFPGFLQEYRPKRRSPEQTKTDFQKLLDHETDKIKNATNTQE